MRACLEQEDDSGAKKMICSSMELNPTQGFLEALLGLLTEYIFYNTVPKGNFKEDFKGCVCGMSWHNYALNLLHIEVRGVVRSCCPLP